MSSISTNDVTNRELMICLLISGIIGMVLGEVLFSITHHNDFVDYDEHKPIQTTKSYGTCYINGGVYLCDAQKTFENFAKRNNGSES